MVPSTKKLYGAEPRDGHSAFCVCRHPMPPPNERPCIFCGAVGENYLGIWHLSDSEADAQRRVHGAVTVFAFCAACRLLTGTPAERFEAAKTTILARRGFN